MTSNVLWAETADGARLPVIDVTNPAFTAPLSDDAVGALSDQYIAESRARAELPPQAMEALRQSRIGKALWAAVGSYLDGLSTYLLKLGPDNLPPELSVVDRRITASFPAVLTRVRLHDVSRLLADGIAQQVADAAAAPPSGAAIRRPLLFVNIAGGPAGDSWNALIRLNAEQPAILADRAIAIAVLDLDDQGPAFGARAVEALRAPGAPLDGLSVAFRHIPYRWTDTDGLRTVLGDLGAAGAACAISSEGGLFEYGSDAEIVANLAALHGATPADATVVGTVTRDGEALRATPGSGRIAATVPRTLDGFRALAAQAGWSVQRSIDRPLSYNLRLVKA